MFALIEMGLGLIIGGAGFLWIVESPLQGCCALFLAGFLVMTGLEKHLSGKAVETSAEQG